METRLRRLTLVRHGETDGESSIRFNGATDVQLSDSGRAQIRAARSRLPDGRFDRVVASPLSRAHEAARILAPDQPIDIEETFREIDFGRWEGLTREEIAERDPDLFEDWMSRGADFDFPEGERRADFRARVREGLQRLLDTPSESALVVVHKGVVRTVAETLCGVPLAPDRPALGEVVHLHRIDSGWRIVESWT